MSQAAIDHALAGYHRFHSALMNSTARKWRDLDVSMQQLRAMYVLRDEGEVPVGRLAEIFGFGMPAASLLADRLVRSGYAERNNDPTDRRRVLLKLSRAGERMLAELHEGSRVHLRRWLAILTAEELDVVDRAWHLMAAAASGAEHEKVTA